MSCDTGISRPIDAFVKYFLDVKPYHTKILEILERYRFNEEVNVSIDEKTDTLISIVNDVLCQGVGFGLDFDDECGFDAESCCDLFTCIGGYGLIYDNSDVLIDLPISQIDANTGTITVPGDRTFDRRLPISSITGQNTFVLNGNRQLDFQTHSLFYVIPFKTLTVLQVLPNGFIVDGNFASLFIQRGTFRVFNSGTNNGEYAVRNAVFDQSTNSTTVTTESLTRSAAFNGNISIASGTKNNTLYQVESVSFDGTSTFVTVRSETPIVLPDENNHGSIMLRTGLWTNRRVWIANSDSTVNNSEWKIISVRYNSVSGTTTIVVDGTLEQPTILGNLQLIGYEFGAGFDGFTECNPPKPDNLHAYISERLNISIFGVTVSPTQTPTPSPTPSPTPEVTQSVTPAVTITPTPSPTPSPTPTPTPVVTIECGEGEFDRITEDDIGRTEESDQCRVVEGTTITPQISGIISEDGIPILLNLTQPIQLIPES